MTKKNTFTIRSSKQLIQILDFITEQGLLAPRLSDTAIALAYNWNQAQHIFPSQKTIAARIEVINVRTVRTYLNKLRDLCLIEYHQPKSEDNAHRANHYKFNYEALANLYTKAKKLAAKLKHEKQEDPQTLDPAPIDPPITSSLRSEEQKENNITETASPVSPWFVEFLKLDSLGNELKHIAKLKKASALNRIIGMKTSLVKARTERDQRQQQWNKEIQAGIAARQKSTLDSIHELNRLSNALFTWNTTGNGFTHAMYNRLIELNKGALSGMEALIAKRFLAKLD